MQLVCIAGYCLNCSFNRDDRNTRKCNVPVAYFDGITQLMVVHGTRSNEKKILLQEQVQLHVGRYRTILQRKEDFENVGCHDVGEETVC